MPGFSQRLGRVSLAASVQMTIKARELKAAGKPVITLTTGEPNFDSPASAIEAGAPGGAERGYQVSAAGWNAGAEGGDPAEVQARLRAGLRAR